MAFTPFVESDRPTMAAFNEKFLECIGEAVGKDLKVEVVEYVGTGGYGEDEPSTLTFQHVPLLAIFVNMSYTSDIQPLYVWGAPSMPADVGSSVSGPEKCTVTVSERTMNWWSTNASAQMNYSNRNYRVTALYMEEVIDA